MLFPWSRPEGVEHLIGVEALAPGTLQTFDRTKDREADASIPTREVEASKQPDVQRVQIVEPIRLPFCLFGESASANSATQLGEEGRSIHVTGFYFSFTAMGSDPDYECTFSVFEASTTGRLLFKAKLASSHDAAGTAGTIVPPVLALSLATPIRLAPSDDLVVTSTAPGGSVRATFTVIGYTE